MNNYRIPIRTIRVKPYESNWENDVKEYFAQFGEIISVEVNSENGIQCGFVEFKLVDGATAALSNAVHQISSHDVTVDAAEPWYQPDQILNALDDDCLRAIFKYFELKDLTNTADVCNRFKKCAEDAFSGRYKTIDLEGRDTNILIKFGNLIRSLNIGIGYYNDREQFITLEMINKYTCQNLEKLSISSMQRSENLNDLLLFAKLKHIELDDCSIKNLSIFLELCPKLEVLKIYGCEIGYCLKRYYLEQLREFHLGDPDRDFKSITKFITRHPSLTKLKLVNKLSNVKSIRLIGQHLHHLEELKLEMELLIEPFDENGGMYDFEKSFRIFRHLNSLKKLKLSFECEEWWSSEPLLNALATAQSPLEMISLNNAHITDGAIESMTTLKQLNIIQLDNVYGLTNDHVIQLSKELPNLQHFILESGSGGDITGTALKTMVRHSKKLSRIEISQADSVSINSSDYFEMLKSVQNRPDKIQLSIILTGPGDIVNVPEEIVAQNREYLLIDEHVYYSDNGSDIDNVFEDYEDDYDYGYGHRYGYGYGSGYDSDY